MILRGFFQGVQRLLRKETASDTKDRLIGDSTPRPTGLAVFLPGQPMESLDEGFSGELCYLERLIAWIPPAKRNGLLVQKTEA